MGMPLANCYFLFATCCSIRASLLFVAAIRPFIDATLSAANGGGGDEIPATNRLPDKGPYQEMEMA